SELATARIDALIVSDPHAGAWAFNIRGADVSHTPLPLVFAVIPKEGRPTLYVDGRKLANAVRDQLEELADVREPAAFADDLVRLGAERRSVRIDQTTGADAMGRLITQAGGTVRRGTDPIAVMKAAKNPVEIEGARSAHGRDGAALTRFLAWFDRE